MNDTRITLLDGAMGTELRARGVNVRDYKSSVWSALACVEAPEAVVQLHRDYIDAGADIITANNFAVTPILLTREGREAQFESLTMQALDCALEARDTSSGNARVAASLPPLNTCFDVAQVGSFEDNLAQYRRLAALLAPHVDLFLCETLCTAEEARAAATAAQESGKPFMVSWTIDRHGRGLRGGDSFETAVASLEALTPGALLVNCTSCTAVTMALGQLRELTDLPIGAYANPVMEEPEGGEPLVVPVDPLGPEAYAEEARRWMSQGASVVGGCCDTNPAFISALRGAL